MFKLPIILSYIVWQFLYTGGDFVISPKQDSYYVSITEHPQFNSNKYGGVKNPDNYYMEYDFFYIQYNGLDVIEGKHYITTTKNVSIPKLGDRISVTVTVYPKGYFYAAGDGQSYIMGNKYLKTISFEVDKPIVNPYIGKF